MDKEMSELIDRYVKGQLNPDEMRSLEEKAKQNEAFRKILISHTELTDAMVEYGQYMKLKKSLDMAHEGMAEAAVRPIEKKPLMWKKYWPHAAAAASVAIVSVVGTVWVASYMDSAREAQFKELSKNVTQIARTQKILEKDIAETKKKGKGFQGNYSGTGFLISKSGYLITSYHVVKGADSVNIENEKFGTLRASVLYNDPANDVSILKIDTAVQSLPFTIEKDETNLAEGVYTLGFPREDVVFGEGAISALSGYKQNPNSYQVSVPVNPGNSGGPLLNSKGDLVGMISGLQTETLGAAFAIKSTVLLSVITSDTLKNSITLSKQNSIRNASRVSQVKQWKDYVFMVRVYKAQ
jgi:serine protease Do